MNKPWIIWTFSALCALAIFSAMGLVTRHTLSLEKDRVKAEARAELEERVRIALWRMDAAASAILLEANNRPISNFTKNNDEQEDAFYVKQYFELNDGVLKNPNEKGRISNLNTLLNQPVKQELQIAPAEKKNGVLRKNIDVIQAATLNAMPSIADDVAQEKNLKTQAKEVSQQRALFSNGVVRNQGSYQMDYNKAEKNRRKAIVSKSIKKSIGQAIQDEKENQYFKSEPLSLSRTPEESKKLSPLKVIQLSPMTPVWLGNDLLLVREVNDGQKKKIQGVWLDVSLLEGDLLSEIIDLLPNAKLEVVKQGVNVLLGLEADRQSDDPMVLATFPWKLLPGEVAEVAAVGWTPMYKTLALAWVGALLAALAAVILLRGVIKLSERRATFVSSVTHELRTPLTTFGLYSDMLAEGMIKDEEKKKNYLHILRRESLRLTHLVENVLSYSRIERGSAKARVEKVSVIHLIQRMKGRLNERVSEGEMILEIEANAHLDGLEIQVDTTAVEQIIFNLVDNACKYAIGEGCGNVITLRVFKNKKRKLLLQVCDQGKGVDKSEHRRLFRAFHKSAKEAAHTKPGVGLGLALSRRLARALGGDLKIVENQQGACFELSLNY